MGLSVFQHSISPLAVFVVLAAAVSVFSKIHAARSICGQRVRLGVFCHTLGSYSERIYS